MLRCALSLLLVVASDAFMPLLTPTTFHPATKLYKGDSSDVVQKHAFSVGTLIEFEEKKRHHVGKILEVAHKSNGSARYGIEEYPSLKHYSIADKEVTYSIPAPTNDRQAEKLLEQLEHALAVSEIDLRQEIDISPELLEMAWEESLTDEAQDMTPHSLVELVHSHTASPIENYMAWRLFKSEMGHVFFKELKENGRVTSFKPKPAKSVEAAKTMFCSHHDDEDEFCYIDDPTTLRP